MLKKSVAKKGTGRAARTIRSLLTISAVGIVLGVYNAVSLHRDVDLAVGPKGQAQEQFFKDASERPDIATFFKNLTPTKRLEMSKNIGRYTDPELAKLCGKCLDTFDPTARAALTVSLAVVAKAHPAATAALLTLPGSFQQIAIAAALRQAGNAALPLVAKEFSETDARANAIAYLVASGPPAIEPTMPYLGNANKDIRLCAADALGKLRATQAVETLTRMFHSSKEDERLAYLTALAGIGDPSSEGLMTLTMKDSTLPTPHRAQAALGLGIIGSTTSLNTLWSYSTDADKSLRESAISALQVAGDSALRLSVVQPNKRDADYETALLQVAGGIHTPLSDSIIETGLVNPSTSALAATVASGRPTLVVTLVTDVRRLDSNSQGDIVDSFLRALTTTPAGRLALKSIESVSPPTSLSAIAVRRSALNRS